MLHGRFSSPWSCIFKRCSGRHWRRSCQERLRSAGHGEPAV